MKSAHSSGSRLFFVGLVVFTTIYLFVILLPFPALKEYTQREAAIEVFDSAGTPLYVTALEDGIRRQYRPLEEIPPDILRIFTLVEDKRFFLHPGVDPVALGRSAFRFVMRAEGATGASTITMQLARMVLNAHGSRSSTLFARKVHELVTAFRIEARLSKKEILELWLNNIPFGYQTEGVAAAARRFFNRDLYSLKEAEVLSVALIPRNPTLYHPLREPERVCTGVLRLAEKAGIVLDRQTACRDIAGAVRGIWPDEAPHFSRLVAASLPGEGAARRVVTTLDLNLQRLAERLLHVHLDKSAGSRIENGAVLLIENMSGSILAYVGSQGFQSPAGGQIDGVQVSNQPGSTIKPFLYAYALEKGFSPNDILADVPTDFGTTEVYVPRNFDRRYHGPVRLRTSLASSLNVPATLLLELLGVREFSSFLDDLGFHFISGADPSGYPSGGLGMALGNVPVTLYELVRAFSVFPREGVYRDLTFVNPAEYALQGASASDRRVISQSTAWMIFDMLSDPAERATGFGLADPFRSGSNAAVKTGTSSRNQHIWALAATRDHTVGVWLGNFSGQTVIGRTGSSVPAGLALEVLSALGREEPAYHTRAQSRAAEICSLSGMAAGSYCPATRYEYIEGDVPPLCTFHVKGFSPFAPTVYPAEFASWAEAERRNAAFESSAGRVLEIRYPVEGAVYFYDRTLPSETQAIKVEVLHEVDKPAVLSVNGSRPLTPGSSSGVMSSWIVPLVLGTMSLEVSCNGETAVRQIQVL